VGQVMELLAAAPVDVEEAGQVEESAASRVVE